MMVNHFNSYYSSELLGDVAENPIAWAHKAKSIGQWREVLDLGIVDAFTAPPSELTRALYQLGLKSNSHGYGYEHKAFASACMRMVCARLRSLDFYESIMEKFGTLATAGAKGALNVIAQAFINLGDIVLTTTPGYSIFKVQAERLGASVWQIPLLPENDYLPDFAGVPSEVLTKAKLLLINYPNNPTGKILSQAETDHILSFALENNLLLINDATYSDIVFEAETAGFFLKNPNVGSTYLEVHSLSKSLQIPGWRLGFILCDNKLLPALRKFSLMQSTGQPKFLLEALAACLPNEHYVTQINKKVKTRLSRLVETLRSSGFDARMPQGTFFCFVESPLEVTNGPSFKSSSECAGYLANELGIIAIPWDVGDRRFLRFSVSFVAGNDEVFFNELGCRLKSKKFVFR